MVQHLDVRMVRFRDVLVDHSCGTAGRTGTTQPVAVCQKCEMWVDLDELPT
jgi:hypothetical protein